MTETASGAVGNTDRRRLSGGAGVSLVDLCHFVRHGQGSSHPLEGRIESPGTGATADCVGDKVTDREDRVARGGDDSSASRNSNPAIGA